MAETLFTVFGSPDAWLLLFIGVLWGLLIGALPGVGSSFAMVIILPFTFWMPVIHALVILMATYTAAIYGGSISACLLNIPGTGGNVVTTFDGYPMSQQGRAGLALGGSAVASEIGNIISATILMVVGPIYVDFALKFGPHEMFMVALWGFVISIIISPGSVAKNIVAGIIGAVLSCIGIGQRYGLPRLTFGSQYLLGGVPLIPAILGIFGITVILQSIVGQKDLITRVRQQAPKLSGFRELGETWIWVILIICSLLGFLIGAIPGTGSLVATLLAYGIFKKVSKRGNEYGKGCYEGVMVAESTNNATHPGAVLTTLVLGIPGEMAMVILLGAFTIHGLRCGPLLLTQHPEFLYTVFLSIMLAGALTLALAWTTLRGWVKAIETPKTYIWPIVLLLCIIGAYSMQSSINDVLIMLGLGVLAFFGEKFGFSKIPLIMGLVLGPIMEDNIRNAILIDAPQAFFTKPIAMALLAILIGTTFLFVWMLRPKKRSESEQELAG